MSRWHRNHPEYEEMGWSPPDWRAHADEIRKRQKEEPDYEAQAEAKAERNPPVGPEWEDMKGRTP